MFPSNDVINEPDFIISKQGFFDQQLTKNDIPVIVEQMVESVLENGNPLQVAEKVKIMELIIDGFKSDKRYKDYALEELAKWGKEGFVTETGAKVQPFEAGGRYDFSVCNDPVVIEMEKNLKARQEFLKKLPKGGLPVVDQVTGEVSIIYPAAKPVSVSTYKITLSKKDND